MENQIQIGIDPVTNNILVAIGPMIKFAMDARSALGFMAGLSTVLSQHPQLQPKPGSQILIAGALPQLAGGINLDGP
jgi:hypothetical protein